MKKLSVIFLFWFISVKTFATDQLIKNLEPLNWWVGMQHPQLQLMVHGDNVASFTPEINYPGVKLVNTLVTDNKNYLFINLIIDQATKPGRFTITFKSGDKIVTHVGYNLLPRIKFGRPQRI